MFSIIEQIIANHFGIQHAELLEGNTRPASDGRHFLWYILHSIMGYSGRTVAQRYGVTPRNVMYYSAVVRDGAKTQPFYSTNLREIQSDLKMLDII